jgi:hypothetical protein
MLSLFIGILLHVILRRVFLLRVILPCAVAPKNLKLFTQDQIQGTLTEVEVSIQLTSLY